MDIELDWQSTPRIWQAWDAATYDGAPDSGRLAQMIGQGATREAALLDLIEQLDDYWRCECDRIAA
jgi:hypothetical protein